MRIKTHKVPFIKVLYLLLFSCFYIPVASQSYARYWVSFQNKNGIQYKLSQPQKFLSARSIERRKKGITYVNFDDLPVSKHYIDSVSSYGLKYIHSSRWFNGALFEVPDENVAGIIQKLSFVKSVEKRSDALKNNEKSMISKWLPMLFSGRQQSDTPSWYGMGYQPIRMMNGFELHKQGFRGTGITIAIIDAGFTFYNTAEVFDSLIHQGRILGYRDFVIPQNTNFNKSTHGTMVLGTMGANQPDFYIGGAPDASYWLLRSEDADTEYPSEEDNWIAAIEFADSAGVDLVNTSLGYFDFDNPIYDHKIEDLDGKTLRISRAARMAAQRGMLLTISAGNSGRTSFPYIGAPADAFDVLTVGAVTPTGEIAAFSSRGFGSRIKPDIVTQGTEIASINENVWFPEAASGTSFSSPVAGASIACLLQAFPEIPVQKIIHAIIATSHRAANPDLNYGYGVPDFVSASNYLKQQHTSEDQGIAYPSVMSNFLIIKPALSGNEPITTECFNMSGQKIFSVRNSGEEILLTNEISRLHEGMYIIRCTSGSEIRTFKALKVIP